MIGQERPAFVPGELVQVFVDRAKVAERSPLGDGWVRVVLDDTFGEFDFPLASKAVNVARLAPVEWPPRPGDVWRDNHQVVWFVSRRETGYEYRRVEITLTPSTDHGVRVGHWSAENLLRERGPMVLVHREHPDPAEPEDGE